MADQTLRINGPPTGTGLQLALAQDGDSTFVSGSPFALTQLGTTGQWQAVLSSVSHEGLFVGMLLDSDGHWTGVTYWFQLRNATAVYRGQTLPPNASVGEVVLAASQPSYAPAKAGDEMDLVDAPNEDALAAIKAAVQDGLVQRLLAGKWAIDNDTEEYVVYEDDGTTEFARLPLTLNTSDGRLVTGVG